MKKLALAVAATLTVSVANAATPAENKALAGAAIKSIFVDFDQVAARDYLTDNYIQHNPHVPTGPDALIGVLPMLQEANFIAKNVRLLSEGDLVVAHNIYENAELFGGEKLVAFDVFRIEDGKFAEHWDNLQAWVPATETASGNSMTDGATAITDLDKTAENKTLVLGFVNDILRDGKGEMIHNYLAPEYIQHNPQVPNTVDGLLGALSGMAEAGIEMTYTDTRLTVAEGNFVFTASEGHLAGAHTAFYDLFRVEDSKIIEHWDVVSEIPAEQAHDNGKF